MTLTLKLNLACGWYDRIEPLRAGEVDIPGVSLNVEIIDDPRELFDLAVRESQFDMVEFSLAEHIAMTARGNSPFVGIPVFTSRVFRHGFICVNANSGITRPQDLAGRTIGVPLYGMSAAVWCRSLLRDDCGVDLSDVRWVEGAMNDAGGHGAAATSVEDSSIRIERNETGRSLSELLAAGEIDATLGALMPADFGTNPDIRRLFPDVRAVELDYYRRTGIHPIMHFIALRREVDRAFPWVANALRAAFSEAKMRALRRLSYTAAPKTMLPFLHSEWEDTVSVFGSDPWPDGVDANRHALVRFIDSMAADGLISTKPDLDAVFLGGL